MHCLTAPIDMLVDAINAQMMLFRDVALDLPSGAYLSFKWCRAHHITPKQHTEEVYAAPYRNYPEAA